MKNQDKDVVKIGKKELVQKTKINWNSGDNETMIHMDFSKPKTRGYVQPGTQAPWLKGKKPWVFKPKRKKKK